MVQALQLLLHSFVTNNYFTVLMYKKYLSIELSIELIYKKIKIDTILSSDKESTAEVNHLGQQQGKER